MPGRPPAAGGPGSAGEHQAVAFGAGAPERWAAINKQGQAGSRQIMLDEADHYMREQNGVLIETVAGWLDEVFSKP